MSKNIELSKYYFQVSNESNFEEIRKFFSESSTYSSQNTGLYLGEESIMEMQKKFHRSFENLNWNIDSINEIKPGIVWIDFTFSGTKTNWETVIFSGYESIIIFNEKIQHIEIKNK